MVQPIQQRHRVSGRWRHEHREEFEEYGLSEKTIDAVGAAKVGLAGLMLMGLFAPKLVGPASTGLAALMLGAIGMHAKVGDPVKRSVPAISVFAGASLSALLSSTDNGHGRR